jgi:hypothetical protein
MVKRITKVMVDGDLELRLTLQAREADLAVQLEGPVLGLLFLEPHLAIERADCPSLDLAGADHSLDQGHQERPPIPRQESSTEWGQPREAALASEKYLQGYLHLPAGVTMDPRLLRAAKHSLGPVSIWVHLPLLHLRLLEMGTIQVARRRGDHGEEDVR